MKTLTNNIETILNVTLLTLASSFLVAGIVGALINLF